MTKKQSDSELVKLWARRSELSKAEWTQLYGLVFQVLKKSHCSVLSSLPLDKTHYIDEYFRDKVYLTTTKENFKVTELFYDNALKTFFCRYLLDFLDDPYLKKALSIEEFGESGYGENYADGEKPLTMEEMTELQLYLDRLSSKFHPEEVKTFLLEFDIKTARQIFELLLELSLDIEDAKFFFLDAELKPKYVNSFFYAGLKLKSVKSSARDFFFENKEWVNLYLSLNTCVDDKTQIPLFKLAELHQIPSYHYRAKDLGITRKKGQFEEGYEKTILGKWLLSLGLSTKIENRGAIEVAFKILCWEALSFTKK